MRYFDQGSNYIVEVNRTEVLMFNDRWPNARIPDAPITFEFSKKNDDLVDLSVEPIDDETDRAVAALSDDAKAYAQDLKLPPPSDKTKAYPPASPRPVFVECGCCGCWHSRDLPGSIDCRDDAHRFTSDELDARYGAAGWDEITLDEQMSAEDRAS